MYKFFVAYLIATFCFTGLVSGQGEIDDQKKIFYRNERSLRGGLNSHGYGADFRYGKRVNFKEKKLYEVHFDILRHPKEQKVRHPEFFSSFVYGKLNLVTSLKFAYGHQKELFPKIDKGGISIKYFYSYGPSFAICKPIYYKVINTVYNPDSSLTYFITDEKFDPAKNHNVFSIAGKSSFFKGFDEIKVIPGAFSQFGFHFEYSSVDAFIHAIEVGAGAEAFIKRVPMMALDKSRSQLFLYLFVRYRFGKIIDPLTRQRKEEYKRYLQEY